MTSVQDVCVAVARAVAGTAIEEGVAAPVADLEAAIEADRWHPAIRAVPAGMTRVPVPQPAPNRGIYVNRTLNLRSVRAVGYDMDYTLVHYRVADWEERAFVHAQSRLSAAGWPVDDLEFDPTGVIRGLAIDLELGNLVKATRFGYVISAAHGTRFLGYDDIRSTYPATVVDLSEPRFEFMNTLFSLSEASLYAQMVDLLGAGVLPGVGYGDLYDAVRGAINDSHQEDELKGEILADPGRFIDLDPDGPLALVDQQAAGKKLMLITNATWEYTPQGSWPTPTTPTSQAPGRGATCSTPSSSRR